MRPAHREEHALNAVRSTSMRVSMRGARRVSMTRRGATYNMNHKGGPSRVARVRPLAMVPFCETVCDSYWMASFFLNDSHFGSACTHSAA
jgi:hypothetical protein